MCSVILSGSPTVKALVIFGDLFLKEFLLLDELLLLLEVLLLLKVILLRLEFLLLLLNELLLLIGDLLFSLDDLSHLDNPFLSGDVFPICVVISLSGLPPIGVKLLPSGLSLLRYLLFL